MSSKGKCLCHLRIIVMHQPHASSDVHGSHSVVHNELCPHSLEPWTPHCIPVTEHRGQHLQYSTCNKIRISHKKSYTRMKKATALQNQVNTPSEFTEPSTQTSQTVQKQQKLPTPWMKVLENIAAQMRSSYKYTRRTDGLSHKGQRQAICRIRGTAVYARQLICTAYVRVD